MSLFTKLFPRQSVNIATDSYLNMITGYQPVFTNFDGGVYESALCRSAIHTFATQCSKLELKSVGTSTVAEKLLRKPNEWQTPSQFLYQVATILECQATCFIFPMLDEMGKTVTGLYALSPNEAKVVQDKAGKYWLKARFNTGGTGYVELSRVGILTKYQYKNMFFGERDNPLRPTLDLIKAQNDGIIEGVKSSASIRFLAQISQTLKPKDLEEERKRFVESNLSVKNNGGVLLYDAKYNDVKQINSTPFVADSKQMELVNESVYSYFNVNKDILENRFDEVTFGAYYSGKLEPFAIQLSQVLTNMLFTDREIGFDNYIVASANRLAFADTKSTVNYVTQMFDRGAMTKNEMRLALNLDPIGEEGDKFFIRLEYAEADKLNEKQGVNNGDPAQGDE